MQTIDKALAAAKLQEMKEALQKCGLADLVAERLVQGIVMACNDSCYSGCSKCCSSGTANRAFADQLRPEATV